MSSFKSVRPSLLTKPTEKMVAANSSTRVTPPKMVTLLLKVAFSVSMPPVISAWQ
jgi:hypothetical protein